MTPQEARRELERRKGQRDGVKGEILAFEQKVEETNVRGCVIRDVQGILQVVAQATQKQLEYHVSGLVSLCLSAVFPDPYTLNLDFELRRGKSEADITFSKKSEGAGEKISPLDASGGGAVDVACFGLRISLWTLQRPRRRSTIVLDEPFRFVSRDLQERASSLLKQISERLGIQFIIITHEPNLLEAADKVFEVEMVDRKSVVKEVAS